MAADRGNLEDPKLIEALENFIEENADPYAILGDEVDKEAKYIQYSPEYLAQKILLEEDGIDKLYIKLFQEHFFQTKIDETRRKYQQLKESTKIWISEISHKLGISGEVLHLWGADKADLEGSVEPLSFLWLSTAAKRAKEIDGLSPQEKTYFDKVQNAYSMNVEYLVTTEPYVEKYKQGELVVIPGGWRPEKGIGHAVGVALIDGRLIWTNTGEGSTPATSGTYICKIADKSKIDAGFIKKLTQCKNQTEFMDTINSVILPNDAIFIKAKQQKVGSCALSNHKKNLRGILPCLMALANRSPEETGDIRDDEIASMLLRSHQIYKKSTVQLRDDALNDLFKAIDRYKISISSTRMDQQEYANVWAGIATLSSNYIDQHFQKIMKKRNKGEELSNKDKEDLERMIKLYKALPESIRLKVIAEGSHIADFIKEVERTLPEETKDPEEKLSKPTEASTPFSPLLQARKEIAHKSEIEFFNILSQRFKEIPELKPFLKDILFDDHFKEKKITPIQIKMNIALKEISQLYTDSGSFKPELEALKMTLESFNCKITENVGHPKNFSYSWHVEINNHFTDIPTPPTQEDFEKRFKENLEKLKPSDSPSISLTAGR